MNLKGFEAYDFSMQTPYFTLTENGVTFNAGVTRGLECAEYASLYINDKEMLMAIVKAQAGSSLSRPYFNNNKKKIVYNVRWSENALRSLLSSLIGCNLSESNGVKVFGRAVTDDNNTPMVVFDLKKAKKL